MYFSVGCLQAYFFLRCIFFFVTIFICVHIDKHFFDIDVVDVCCFLLLFHFHENLHPGQGEPNSRTLPPCPKEKLCTLLFSYCFQFGESFTRGERLENLSLMKMKDWATQNTRRCAFQRGYSLICDYNCYGISNKCSFYPMRPAKYSLRKITQNLFLPQQDYLFELDWTDISFFL